MPTSTIAVDLAGNFEPGTAILAGLVAFMMPVMLTMMHPLVRSGDMPAPGIAMTELGKMTPMGIVMAHVAFGLVAGAVYVAVVG
jgi:hypothetical protein